MRNAIQIWYEGHDHPTALPILADSSRSRYWWRALAHVNQYIAPSGASFVLYDDIHRVTFREGLPVRHELEVLMRHMLEEEQEALLEHAGAAGNADVIRAGERQPLPPAMREGVVTAKKRFPTGSLPEAYDNTAVVVAEDNDAHADLIEGYTRSGGYTGTIYRYSDGEETIMHLEEHVEKRRALLFLDIRLPRINGFDVLRWMKASTDRRAIPVIMLSTSASETDVEASYSLGANGYLIKQLDPVAFFEMIERTIRYWFRWNRMR